MAGLTGTHLIAVLVIIVLLFGAAKLPALAKSMGQSARVFRGEMKAMKEENAADESGDARNVAETSVSPSNSSPSNSSPSNSLPSGEASRGNSGSPS